MSGIRSMTGFGRGAAASALGSLEVEIKSVNHRYLDLRLNLPREFAACEAALTRLVRERLARGKVDATFRWTPAAEAAPRLRFNVELLRYYQAELASVAMPLRREDSVSFEYILGLPGVTEKESPSLDAEGLAELAARALAEGLEGLVSEREREGRSLAEELAGRIATLERLRAEIENRSGLVLEAYRERLEKKAAEWARLAEVELDDGRIETEIMLYADRADVTEELVRLRAHFAAFRENLKGGAEGDPPGKVCDFLCQEILRETNTVASKSRDSELAASVIAMKNEIEKIREQILNVE